MAAKENLKIIIGADTKDFSAGAKQVKTDLKNLSKESSGALQSIGEAFGVNSSKVESLSSAFRGLSAQAEQAGSKTAVLFSGIAKAAGPAAVAIGACTAAFKLLHAEAENYASLMGDGSIYAAGIDTYKATYKQAMHDVNSETGRAIQQMEGKWSKFWTRLGANASNFFINFNSASKNTPFSTVALFQAGRQTADQSAEAKAKAEEAERLGQRLEELRQQQIGQMVTISELDAKIAESRRIATDKEEDLTKRAEARQAAIAAIHEKYALQKPLLNEIADIMAAIDALADNTKEETEATAMARIAANQALRDEENEYRALNRITSTINSEMQKQVEAAQKLKALEAEINQTIAPKAIGNISTGGIDVPAALSGIEPITVPIKPEIDERQLLISSQMLTDAFSTVAAGIGESIASIGTGEGAWKGITNAAVTAFADMAIQVGRITLATGLAAEGIKASLESLNPVLAIAAGTALIALGTAAKSALSNVASGAYGGASSNVASGAYSSASAEYQSKEMNIKISGTLVGRGNDLLAIINSEQDRRYYTAGGR